jgi:protoporphyrinogen/coproporphyrinogen III oxidase
MIRSLPGGPPHVVVVGGGLTGLSAAYRMAVAAREGRIRVSLLEASWRFGGMVRTARPEGLVIEEGPDSFLVRKPWARDLAVALGLGDRLVATPPANRRSFIYHAGRLHRLPAGVNMGVPSRLGPVLRSGLLSPAGKLRALLDLVLPRVLEPGDGDVALGRLLGARLGREAVERLAEPLLSGIYAGGADALSLNATFPALRRQEAEHRSLIRAAMAEARRTRAVAQAGAPQAPPPVFLTLRGGLERMVDALRDALAATPGVSLRLAAPVRSLERAGLGGYTLRLDGEDLHADAVIVTTPAPEAASVLKALAPEAARELGEIAYADVALVALAFARADVPQALAGSGFVVPRNEDIGITACTWVSAKWPDSAPPETVLLRAYLGRAGSGVLDLDDRALLETARAALRRSMAIDAAPHLVRVIRVPRGLPQYAVHHLARLDRIEAALGRLPGVTVTGSAFRGVGLPDCIRQGSQAAEAALAWATSATPA